RARQAVNERELTVKWNIRAVGKWAATAALTLAALQATAGISFAGSTPVIAINRSATLNGRNVVVVTGTVLPSQAGGLTGSPSVFEAYFIGIVLVDITQKQSNQTIAGAEEWGQVAPDGSFTAYLTGALPFKPGNATVTVRAGEYSPMEYYGARYWVW